jgi:hypothetical protein
MLVEHAWKYCKITLEISAERFASTYFILLTYNIHVNIKLHRHVMQQIVQETTYLLLLLNLIQNISPDIALYLLEI